MALGRFRHPYFISRWPHLNKRTKRHQGVAKSYLAPYLGRSLNVYYSRKFSISRNIVLTMLLGYDLHNI